MAARGAGTRTRWRAHLVLAAVLALIGALLAPALARADGDPASDVLASRAAFVPGDTGSAADQAHLEAVAAAATRAGYPIRVAVIGSRSDLGSVTQLWRQPQAYAQFLGTELSLVSRSRVLVVMPNGFGLSVPGASPAQDLAELRRAPAPTQGTNLATFAAGGVASLARTAGDPLGPVAASHVATVAGGSETVPELAALLAGIALVAAAWTFSLRARPLRTREAAR